MFKDNRYINAGQNEICRYGRKARERVEAFLEANDKGYYSFPVDGGKYWTIGTSDGKYGEFAKVGDTFFSVNKGGYMYAKADSDKGAKFVEALKNMIAKMNELDAERIGSLED